MSERIKFCLIVVNLNVRIWGISNKIELTFKNSYKINNVVAKKDVKDVQLNMVSNKTLLRCRINQLK